uniref:Slc6a-15 n=1 Tax=Schmidtea mediterranea TaxID=79327 RepID=A0A0H3YEX8_SCHMD|nr:slc6a-15 [Schmidtea mediterranea]
MGKNYLQVEENEDSPPDIIYGSHDDENDLEQHIFVPYFMRNAFDLKRKIAEPIYRSEIERGQWNSEFEYLLSCAGYIVGLGNVWRFPGKVYQGGGGSFLLPYIFFCIVFGCPMLMLETALGQFSSKGIIEAFQICPIFSGLGYTIVIVVFLIATSYSVIIAWCVLYFVSSFNYILPWSVCTNKFNTPLCFGVSETNYSKYNSSYRSSTFEFWNRYVLADERLDGTFVKVTDSIGFPNVPSLLCLFAVLCLASIIIMFGVKVSGKVVYLTVILPYIVIFQFIVLGCSLPGALNGIKFYLYPRLSRLLDPHTYVLAMEQLMFSLSVGAGGLVTMSSYNKFQQNIQRNVFILMSVDFSTSLISGFATFPVLGYMSYRTGKDIEELIVADSSLFFLIFPEVLSTLTSSNAWSILFMFMAFTLGIDSLFVMLEVIITSISDLFPKFQRKKHKIALTVTVGSFVFLGGLIYTTPGGLNWLDILNENCPNFIITAVVFLEVFIMFGIYGHRQFQHDIWLMNGENLGIYWISCFIFFVPLLSIIMWIEVIRHTEVIVRHGENFPRWTFILNWVINILFLSPILIKAIYVVIRNRKRYPSIGIIQILKLCFRPIPIWGPRSKRFWIHSVFYSKKLIKYKDNKRFLSSLTKEENIIKLVKLAQLKIDEEKELKEKKEKEERNEEENEEENGVV